LIDSFKNETKKLNVAVIGCTGLAGQSLVEALIDHPWFEITSLHGDSSVGGRYGEQIKGSSAVVFPPSIRDCPIRAVADLDLEKTDLVFSAIPSKFAQKIEGKIAKSLPVFSTASSYRYEPDIPIYLPIVNQGHMVMLDSPQSDRQWQGFVCPGPNCTTVGLAIALYPIYKTLGLSTVHVVSLQAISGGGYNGVAAYDIIGNIIPHIPQEEQKVRRELRKIFAAMQNPPNNLDLVEPEFLIDCKCTRVPVIDGHVECVFFTTDNPTTLQELQSRLTHFVEYEQLPNLPSLTQYPITLFSDREPFRPQPRIDLQNATADMVTFVGGLEETEYENGFKMTILSHNTKLGAGKGAVLNAEFWYAHKFLTNTSKSIENPTGEANHD
jgi:aspartate-semialdehyde dehydrogenase